MNQPVKRGKEIKVRRKERKRVSVCEREKERERGKRGKLGKREDLMPSR